MNILLGIALNALKTDQIRTRDLVLSKIIENPDSFYKAVNDIDTRADFFSAMYKKTGAVWFKLAEDTSRSDLQGIIFGSGNLFHNLITTTVENVSSYGNKSQYNLENWRSEAGKVIMRTGYESLKNIFQNYQNFNITQWSIDQKKLIQVVNDTDDVQKSTIYAYTNNIANQAHTKGYSGIVYNSSRHTASTNNRAVVLFGDRYDAAKIKPILNKPILIDKK